ncbi:MAG: phosphoribosylamine--glycine ligase [Spirochaetes bacterium GWD1_27_9]|nr:MAG: phosphoribosylamine--glycine ligase [Spirochaetes bacterium GWB1_27_13]OHD20013.1 MAG: phosphoribosylamine--glycine ligase [Spirochaetes bacterium GWC1_27_15]OHD30496.1 MAG: phosphoribosylamine--glycine ligase [Spirochaetes bacterium GWD1_27_9]
MNVLLIGGGGREHTIAKKIKESKRLGKFYAIPGNPGIKNIAEVVNCDLNIKNIVNFAKNNAVDLIVCGPEQPLVEGLSDLAKESGIPVFGPSKNGAKLEGSKIYSKEIMAKYDIPTSDYKSFYDYESAYNYIQKRLTYPIVIKADGLAAGKGVKIVQNREDAFDVIKSYMVDKALGASSEHIIIEDFMVGEEMSALYVTDGKTFIPLLPARDYKKVFDDDKGENTGGMGCYAPHNSMTKDLQEEIETKIIHKLKIALEKEGIDYKGVLYVGLMLTNEGAKVVEFNCRFGDPETQVIVPLIESDLLELMYATAKGKIDNQKIKWKNDYAACVVIAMDGYPGDYKKGVKINFKTSPFDFIHAGTKYDGEDIVTNGGRVLNAVALGTSKTGALEQAYKLAQKVSFDGAFYRKDIGK